MRTRAGLAAGGLCLLVAAGLFVYQRQVLRPSPPVSAYVAARTEVFQVLHRQGLLPAVEKLRAIAASDQAELVAKCHGLAHELGHEALRKLGFSAAFAVQDDVCGSGYIHGVVEARFEGVTADQLPTLVRTTCAADDARCFHGLGHGLMVATGNDRLAALNWCRTVRAGFARIQCFEGVFMEHFAAEGHHDGAVLSADHLFDACHAEPDPERSVCAFYAPRAWLQAHAFAYDQVFAWCRSEAGKAQDACLKGAGSAAMKYQVYDPSLAAVVCARQSGLARRYCVEGATSYLIVHHARTGQGSAFCDMLVPQDAQVCQRVVAAARPFYDE